MRHEAQRGLEQGGSSASQPPSCADVAIGVLLLLLLLLVLVLAVATLLAFLLGSLMVFTLAYVLLRDVVNALTVANVRSVLLSAASFAFHWLSLALPAGTWLWVL